MNPTSLWSMPCLAIEVLLAGAYEWRELADLMQSSGRPLPEHDNERQQAWCISRLAHELCHEAGPFARRVQHQLDHRFAASRLHVATSEPDELAEEFHSERGIPLDELTGLFWGLLRDEREDMRALAAPLVQQVQQLALRNLLNPPPCREIDRGQSPHDDLEQLIREDEASLPAEPHEQVSPSTESRQRRRPGIDPFKLAFISLTALCFASTAISCVITALG